MADRINKKVTVTETYRTHGSGWARGLARVFGLRFRQQESTDESGNPNAPRGLRRSITGILSRRTTETD